MDKSVSDLIYLLLGQILPQNPEFASKIPFKDLPYNVSLYAFIHNPLCIKYIPDKYTTKTLFLDAYYSNYDYMILDYLPKHLMKPSIYLEIFEDSPEKIELLNWDIIDKDTLMYVIEKLGLD